MAENFRRLDALLDYDPNTGVSQTFHMDVDGVMTLRTDQDETALRAAAHEEHMSRNRSERIGEWQKVATIPVVVMYDLIKRGIWFDPDRKKRWLNSVEAAPYRTHWARL
jgi:hypothetical protein